MRLNGNGWTIAPIDVLVRGIGEIIGGSEHEERLKVLDRSMAEHGIDQGGDLRRDGTAPHTGFGFKRTLAYVTGFANVRDAIPLPRTPGSAPYRKAGQ